MFLFIYLLEEKSDACEVMCRDNHLLHILSTVRVYYSQTKLKLNIHHCLIITQ